MEYPTEEEACNVTTRSVAREKSRLERKIREEQTQKNDAWLRADAVYMAEFEKLRSQVETLKCELARQQDISKNSFSRANFQYMLIIGNICVVNNFASDILIDQIVLS